MKNFLRLISILALGVLVFTGCSKKQPKVNTQVTQQPKQEVKQEEDIKVTNDQDILSELLVEDTENTEANSDYPNSNSNKESQKKIQIMEDDINYNELEYDRHENVIFNCDYVQDATQKDGDITVLATKIIGSISGLPGTYELVVPYSLEWKRGDKALVNYEIAYEGEFTSYVRDVEFLQKINNEYIERQKELQAKAEEEARLLAEAQAKAEAESREAEEKKQKAQAKKQADSQAAKKAQQAQAQAAAQQALEAQRIQESINALINGQ